MDNTTNVNQNKNDKDDVKGFLKTVEKLGNKLPHPAIIFLSFCVLIVAVSAIF